MSAGDWWWQWWLRVQPVVGRMPPRCRFIDDGTCKRRSRCVSIARATCDRLRWENHFNSLRFVCLVRNPIYLVPMFARNFSRTITMVCLQKVNFLIAKYRVPGTSLVVLCLTARLWKNSRTGGIEPISYAWWTLPSKRWQITDSALYLLFEFRKVSYFENTIQEKWY